MSQKQEQKNVIVNDYETEIEKSEIVWENVHGQLTFDSAGNPMDASRKERFLGRAEGQEEVREIYFTSDIEEAARKDRQRRRRQAGEAVRDTIDITYSTDFHDYCYSITDPGAIEPADHGVEMPEHFNSQTSAKITLFGESKNVHEPGVNPAELAEAYQQQFRNASRDPWLDPSEEYKQKNELQKII